MPRFSNVLKQHPVSISFEYEQETLTVVFDRNKITGSWANGVQRAIASGAVGNEIYAATADLLISWDVVDDNDNTLPPSAEILSQLPIAAFEMLSEAIGKASTPSSEEGNGSSADSSPRQPEPSTASMTPPPASPSASLNGPQPSQSQTPLASPLQK